jgi:hypothetical protein
LRRAGVVGAAVHFKLSMPIFWSFTARSALRHTESEFLLEVSIISLDGSSALIVALASRRDEKVRLWIDSLKSCGEFRAVNSY